MILADVALISFGTYIEIHPNDFVVICQKKKKEKKKKPYMYFSGSPSKISKPRIFYGGFLCIHAHI